MYVSEEMSERVIVGVKQGDLRGRKVNTKSGLHYYSFQGIPYAKPPVGNLRFQAPQPADAWPGIRDALVEGAVCPQLDDLQGCCYKGDEDCLFLNVYTCQLPSGLSDYKAVMVWFHGGGFGFGSGNTDFYGPDYLLEGGVVVVTVNYRLGPLGFLSLPDAGVSGNVGLKDQVMALRWVQQNIKQFGGDPDKVTIFGASAGGASVHYHILSPMSAGLFHRAIMQGGSAVNPWAYDDPPTARKKAFRLGEMLGLKTADSKELLEFLQSLSAKEILTGLHKGLTGEDTFLLVLYSVPTQDNENDYGEVFLPDSPHSLLARGKFYDVPLIAGISSHEGMLMLNALLKKPHLLTFVDSNFHLLLPKTFNVGDRADATTEIVQKVKQFYFGNKALSKDTLSNYVELISDVQFANGINYTIKQHVAFCKSPVFYYHFAFEGNRGLLKNILGFKDLSGTCHGDEGGYLFNPSVLDVAMDSDSPEAKMSQRLVKLWTNFAKTGNPTPGPDHMLDVIWKPATTSELVYLNIDKEMSMRHNLRSESISFWEEISKTTPEKCD